MHVYSSCSDQCLLAEFLVYHPAVGRKLTDFVLWVDILVRPFSPSSSTFCAGLCLKKSIIVLRLEAFGEDEALSCASICSGGMFSLASCTECLLPHIIGSRIGELFFPPSSSSTVLDRRNRISLEFELRIFDCNECRQRKEKPGKRKHRGYRPEGSKPLS